MKKLYLTVLVVVLSLGLMNAFGQTKHQFDKEAFVKLAKKNIGAVLSGSVDADAMLVDMEKLVQMGVAGCQEHMDEAETPEQEKGLMKLVIDGSAKMKDLKRKEIEEQWHEGAAAKKVGIDLEAFDHFAEVMCHYDAVVHPVTCIICLKEYKATGNDELLEQIKSELQEVVEHMKHLE